MNQLAVRKEAQRVAGQLISLQPVYLDTETTGIGMRDEVIEVCVLEHDGSVLFDSLVRPQVKISLDARRVHGIEDALLAKAPTWPEVWPGVERAIAGMTVAVYNADFDVRMMQQSHLSHAMPWEMGEDAFACIMRLYAQYYGQWDPARRSYRWQSLANAAMQCGISLPNTHRAKDDALLARAILQWMAGAEAR